MANEAPATLLPAADLTVADIEATLARFLLHASGALTALDPATALLASVARDSVLAGGKRLRPTFAFWGWRGAAGAHAPVEPVLPALAALELLHTFALVHDDVMDASATRRGRPAAHRVFTDWHRQHDLRGSATRFGDAGAILVGDLCLVWADQLLATAEIPAADIHAAREIYDRMRIEVVGGQFLDIFGDSARNWTTHQALRTAQLKTASYTVTRPLLYGAALSGSGADGTRTAAYHEYGLAVGEAFQLRDDLLGVYGDAHDTGKPVGDDLITAKPTVLLQLARSLADPRQARALERALRGRHRDPGRIGALIAATGAKGRVERMISERVAMAQAALARAPIDDPVKAALTDIAASAAWRTA